MAEFAAPRAHPLSAARRSGARPRRRAPPPHLRGRDRRRGRDPLQTAHLRRRRRRDRQGLLPGVPTRPRRRRRPCLARRPLSRPAIDPILPDLLAPGMRVVFCGTAPGTASARAGAYYAGPGNRFWATLHEVGLTPILLAPGRIRAAGRLRDRPHRRQQDGLRVRRGGRQPRLRPQAPDRGDRRRRPPPPRLQRQERGAGRARPAGGLRAADRRRSAAPASGSCPRPPAPPAASGTSARGATWPRRPVERLGDPAAAVLVAIATEIAAAAAWPARPAGRTSF